MSPGCEHCYAETMAARFSDPGYWGHGFATRTAAGGRWTRDVALIPEKLAEPLKWRKPRSCFVNSTSDLFHEKLTFEEIAAVVGIIAACPGHIFISLTKRAKRQREWGEWIASDPRSLYPSVVAVNRAFEHLGRDRPRLAATGAGCGVVPWPLPNWWVGVSAEDQQRWDERVPELLRTPAAVRVVSVEPMLGPVSVENYDLVRVCDTCASGEWRSPCSDCASVDWVIIGGESGPGARPFHFEWMGDLVEQCRDAGVKVFCKQGGSNAYWGGLPLKTKDKKGGDPSEWPPGDWPREFPKG